MNRKYLSLTFHKSEMELTSQKKRTFNLYHIILTKVRFPFKKRVSTGYCSEDMIIRSFNDHEQMKFLQNIQKTVWGQTFLLFFFLIGIYSMPGWTATTRHWVARKTTTKRLKHTENLFRKNLQLKDVCYF